MKNLAIAFLVFCTFISVGYSFKCYKCSGPDGKDYTRKQCEKDQTKVDCGPAANFTCFKLHGTSTKGIKAVARGCWRKQQCESIKKICGGTEQQKKAMNVKECEAACCVSDGDTPCNSGFTVSIDVVMIMLAVLCSLKNI